MATIIHQRMLEAVATSVENDPAAALARIDPATLKLVKDAQDRGLGAPKASVDLLNTDGSLKREPIRDAIKDVLGAIHGCKPDTQPG